MVFAKLYDAGKCWQSAINSIGTMIALSCQRVTQLCFEKWIGCDKMCFWPFGVDFKLGQVELSFPFFETLKTSASQIANKQINFPGFTIPITYIVDGLSDCSAFFKKQGHEMKSEVCCCYWWNGIYVSRVGAALALEFLNWVDVKEERKKNFPVRQNNFWWRIFRVRHLHRRWNRFFQTSHDFPFKSCSQSTIQKMFFSSFPFWLSFSHILVHLSSHRTSSCHLRERSFNWITTESVAGEGWVGGCRK